MQSEEKKNKKPGLSVIPNLTSAKHQFKLKSPSSLVPFAALPFVSGAGSSWSATVSPSR